MKLHWCRELTTRACFYFKTSSNEKIILKKQYKMDKSDYSLNSSALLCLTPTHHFCWFNTPSLVDTFYTVSGIFVLSWIA